MDIRPRTSSGTAAKLINVLIAFSLVMVTLCVVSPGITALEKPPGESPSLEIDTDKSVWLDPETRRNLQVFNVIFALVMLGLLGVSYVLRRRLKQKVSILQETQQELQDKNEFMRIAIESTSSVIWEFHPAREAGFLSKEWYVMFGYDPVDRELPLSEWRKFVHPRDLEKIEQAFFAFLKSGGQGSYSADFRIRRNDGTWHWVLAKGQSVEWDETGKPLRIIGLHVDIQNIKEAQEELAMSEERFRALFQFAPVPLATITRDGRVVAVNEQFARVIGITADTSLNLEQWWDYAYPDPEYRADVISTWQKDVEHAIATNSAVEPREYQVTCSGGVIRDMIISAAIIGEYILVSFFDITEKNQAKKKIKRSLQEKETLLRELYHRTKNNMQVISSLVNLSANKITDAETANIIKEIDSKIHTMSLVHKKLYESRDLSQINLKDYLIELAAYLSSFYTPISENIAISVQGEDLYLLIDTAIPLGMVFNELISNALKYAFPDKKNGSINIQLVMKDDGTMAATVADNGIGLPDGFTIDENASLGLQVASSIVRQQLMGDISFESGKGRGTSWTITFNSKLYKERV